MTAPTLLAVFVASLLGSLHCAAMCGGFVTLYAAGSRRALAHLSYHSARLCAYLGLGLVAGALGSALDLAGRAAGLGRIAGVVAGSLIVLGALASLLELAGIASKLRLASGPRARVVALLGRVAERPPLQRAALIGLSSALLPCGWLYAFVASAAASGSVAGGAAVMAAFWAGTLPMLLGVAALVQAIAPRLRRHVPVLSAALLLAIGLSAVIGRFDLGAAAGDVTQAPSPQTPPCHH